MRRMLRLTRIAAGACVAVAVAIGVPGCGAADGAGSESPATSAAGSNQPMEAATVRGLAAAMVAHIERDRLTGGLAGTRNGTEQWMNVEARVEGRGAAVQLDTMVFWGSDVVDQFARRKDFCASEDHPWVLSCRATTAADGSTVIVEASTEDVVGGRSPDGFFLSVTHVRDNELVRVTEALNSRKPSYLDMTALPVDVQVLRAIATDPSVGVQTTAELNDAGQDIPHFS